MADTKLTALTETTSPATSDDVYIVTTPGGTPASKRCTIANLRTAMATVLRSGSTTGDHLAVWNGSNAESLKDGGVVLADGTWTSYGATSTIVGWGSFTKQEIYYKIVGKTVFVAYNLQGTSNSTSTTFTLPVAAVANPEQNAWFGWTGDNGANYNVGVSSLAGGASTAVLSRTAAGLGWTAGGTKIAQGQFWYVTT